MLQGSRLFFLREPPTKPLTKNARVWIAALFYGVKGLRALAIRKTMGIFSKRGYWWKDFRSAVSIIWGSTPVKSQLRKAYLAEFLKMQHDVLDKSGDVTAQLRECGDFLFDALRMDQQLDGREEQEYVA